jgi:hypothetical protein
MIGLDNYNDQKQNFLQQLRKNRKNYLSLGLTFVLVFLVVLYLVPFGGLERFGFLAQKKGTDQPSFAEENANGVLVVKRPIQGNRLMKAVNITLATSGIYSPQKIELFVDNKLVKTFPGTGAYAFSWDTSLETDGSHIIKAVAYLSDGKAVNSSGIIVKTINNCPDLNEDGVLNILDVQAVAKKALVSPVVYDPLFDLNGNGALENLDVMLIAKFWQSKGNTTYFCPLSRVRAMIYEDTKYPDEWVSSGTQLNQSDAPGMHVYLDSYSTEIPLRDPTDPRLTYETYSGRTNHTIYFVVDPGWEVTSTSSRYSYGDWDAACGSATQINYNYSSASSNPNYPNQQAVRTNSHPTECDYYRVYIGVKRKGVQPRTTLHVRVFNDLNGDGLWAGSGEPILYEREALGTIVRWPSETGEFLPYDVASVDPILEYEKDLNSGSGEVYLKIGSNQVFKKRTA